MTDRRLELMIGVLLRAGVMLAAAVVAIGGIWYLAISGMKPVDYHQFHAARHGFEWMRHASGPEMAIQIGLLLLVATPVARVIFALVGFALERDHIYVWITIIVLVVLAYSISSSWL